MNMERALEIFRGSPEYRGFSHECIRGDSHIRYEVDGVTKVMDGIKRPSLHSIQIEFECFDGEEPDFIRQLLKNL